MTLSVGKWRYINIPDKDHRFTPSISLFFTNKLQLCLHVHVYVCFFTIALNKNIKKKMKK